jgi:hypothetical protein
LGRGKLQFRSLSCSKLDRGCLFREISILIKIKRLESSQENETYNSQRKKLVMNLVNVKKRGKKCLKKERVREKRKMHFTTHYL